MTPWSMLTLPAGPSSVKPGVSFEIAGLADGRMDAELELLGHRDLHLRGLADRPQHAHAFDPAFRSDDGDLFLAGKLAGLGEVALRG